jgi:hypothetical protein
MNAWRTEKLVLNREYDIDGASTALNAHPNTLWAWVRRGWLISLPNNPASFTGQAVLNAVRIRHDEVSKHAKQNRGRRRPVVTKSNIT